MNLNRVIYSVFKIDLQFVKGIYTNRTYVYLLYKDTRHVGDRY
jgi:hypothetical protein